jgi:putative solute:sodium symporter small subunit
MSTHESPPDRPEAGAALTEEHRRYWRTNKNIVAVLLVLWFFVGCVLSIFLAEPLNQFRIGGFKLGFWFAQQGSIYIFIVLILIYCLLMEREDRKFHVEERKERGA